MDLAIGPQRDAALRLQLPADATDGMVVNTAVLTHLPIAEVSESASVREAREEWETMRVKERTFL